MPLKIAFWLSLTLSGAKLLGFYLSGSMIVLASFYDSLTDSIMSYVNFIFYLKAREKADLQHPFGHGGFEVVSGLLQGLMITTFGFILAYQAVTQLSELQSTNFDASTMPVAIAIMLISAASGYGIQWYLGIHERRMRTRGEVSMTLSSDRAHYLSDFVTNIFGVVGILSVFLTESKALDSILGLAGAGLLLKTAWPLVKNSFSHIMHVGAEIEVQHEILTIVNNFNSMSDNVHKFRARRMGQSLFIDFHMKLPAQMPLTNAHALSELIELEIKKRFPDADVLIHLDPDDLTDEVEL